MHGMGKILFEKILQRKFFLLQQNKAGLDNRTCFVLRRG